MSTARKFVDADLRLEPQLIAVAISYAEQYKGEFGFLLDARQVVMETGSLPLPVARGVLNCMRVDPMVVGLEQLQRAREFDVSDYVEHPHEHRDLEPIHNGITDVAYDEVEQVPEFEDEEDDEPKWRRPWHLETPAKVKVPFVHTQQRRAVLHRVGIDNMHRFNGELVTAYYTRSFPSEYWPYSDRVPDDVQRTAPLLLVHRQCGRYPLVDPVLVGEKPKGMTYCRSGCFGWWCNRCKKRTTLSEGQSPNGVVSMCDYCPAVHLKQEWYDLRLPA
jgi:hypothetical protein